LVPFFAITTADGDTPYFTATAKNGASVSKGTELSRELVFF
jgi:hypothetical protein